MTETLEVKLVLYCKIFLNSIIWKYCCIHIVLIFICEIYGKFLPRWQSLVTVSSGKIKSSLSSQLNLWKLFPHLHFLVVRQWCNFFLHRASLHMCCNFFLFLIISSRFMWAYVLGKGLEKFLQFHPQRYLWIWLWSNIISVDFQILKLY